MNIFLEGKTSFLISILLRWEQKQPDSSYKKYYSSSMSLYIITDNRKVLINYSTVK
jgi:hypothetical protein